MGLTAVLLSGHEISIICKTKATATKCFSFPNEPFAWRYRPRLDNFISCRRKAAANRNFRRSRARLKIGRQFPLDFKKIIYCDEPIKLSGSRTPPIPADCAVRHQSSITKHPRLQSTNSHPKKNSYVQGGCINQSATGIHLIAYHHLSGMRDYGRGRGKASKT